MKILGIDTTGDVCSVGIIDENKLLCDLYLHDKNTHSINLMPLIDKCLNLCGLKLDDIDAFALNIGPGSFTGIRIGVCTIKGFVLENDKPCIEVNTLDCLAENAYGFCGTICAMIDARRCESYFAFYESDKNGIKRIIDYDADKLEVFLDRLPDGDVCFVGDGALNYKDIIIEKLSDRAIFLNDVDMYQNARGVLKIAARKANAKEFMSVFNIMPYYHKKSQAERMKDKAERS